MFDLPVREMILIAAILSLILLIEWATDRKVTLETKTKDNAFIDEQNYEMSVSKFVNTLFCKDIFANTLFVMCQTWKSKGLFNTADYIDMVSNEKGCKQYVENTSLNNPVRFKEFKQKNQEAINELYYGALSSMVLGTMIAKYSHLNFEQALISSKLEWEYQASTKKMA